MITLLLTACMHFAAASPLAPKPQASRPGRLLALPFAYGNKIYTTRLTGKDTAAFCVQEGSQGRPKPLLDSAQDPYLPRFPLDAFSLSNDGRYLAYFLPQIRHRFERIRVMDLKTGRLLPDDLKWTYLSDLAWVGNGFYYGRYAKPSDVASLDSSPHPADHLNEKIYYHRIGEPPSADRLAFEDGDHPGRKYLYLTGFNRKWMHVHMLSSLASKDASSEWFCRLGPGKWKLRAIQPTIAPGRFFSCDDLQDRFLMYTNYRSPKGRVIEIDPERPSEPNWKTVVPETSEKLTDAEPAAGKLILIYRVAQGGSRAEVRSVRGKLEELLPIPRGADADVQWSGPAAKEIFYSIQFGTQPKSYFRYVLTSKHGQPFP